MDQIEKDLKRIKGVNRAALREVILSACDWDPSCYYQGLHDLCAVILRYNGGRKGKAMRQARMIANLYLRDYLHKESLLDALEPRFKRIEQILRREGHSLAAPPLFMTSWLLTWFSHDTPTPLPIFHFLMQSPDPSHRLLYLSAAFFIHQRDRIVDDEGEMHQVLKTIPGRTRNLKKVFAECQRLESKKRPKYFLFILIFLVSLLLLLRRRR